MSVIGTTGEERTFGDQTFVSPQVHMFGQQNLNAMLADYRRDGFVHLRGAFSTDEISSMQAECTRLISSDVVDRDNVRTPFRMNSGDLPERIDPVCDISPLFWNFANDDRLLNIVRCIFSNSPTALFKDKLIFKLPGTNGYTAHQDQPYYPDGTSLSVSVQIDAANAENGGLELFSGYHHKLMTPPGERRNWTTEEEAAWLDPARGYLPQTESGDILIFDGLTPHRSGRNLTVGEPRRSLYLSYLLGGSADLRTKYYAEYVERWAKDGKFFR
jgi:ectoine hydroxylase-related dioxygenase (phytanoyl-CoA dioxygenase family)